MIVITDIAGPVGGIVARRVLEAGGRVRLVAGDHRELAGLEGGERVCCGFTDPEALAAAFQGASALYLAVPHSAKYREDFIEFHERVSDAYASAAAAVGVGYAVCQSSAGAQPQSANPLLAALGRLEERLNAIAGLNALHLRPSHYLENLGAELVPEMNVLIGAIASDVPLPLVFPQDVAEYAAERLRHRDFSGHQTQELLGERDLTMPEIAAIIGRSLNKPGMNYVQLPRPALEQWLKRVRLPEGVAGIVMDLWNRVNRGELALDVVRGPANTTPTSLEAFLARGWLRPSASASQKFCG